MAPDLADLIAAKCAEFEAAGVMPMWRYRWPFGPFPTDSGQRTSPHGDPLRDLVDPPSESRP